jgi:hypothetical protein
VCSASAVIWDLLFGCENWAGEPKGAGTGLINLGWCRADPVTHYAGVPCQKRAILQRCLFAKLARKSLKSFGQNPSEPNKIAVSIGETGGGHFGNSRPKPLKSLHRTPSETKRNGFSKK